MPRLLVFLLGMLLTAAVAAGLFAGGLLRFRQEQQHRFEGKGYDSPEEALLDYADALKTGDIDRMISAYAIESYSENYDTLAYIRRYQSFSNSRGTFIITPTDNEIVKRINLENRYAAVTELVRRQYESLRASYKGEEPFSGGKPVQFDGTQGDSTQAAEVRRYLRGLKDLPEFQEMELGSVKRISKFLRRLGYDDEVLEKHNSASIEPYKSYTGAEEYESLAVEFSLDDRNGILTAGCVCYDGKWYLTDYNLISMFAGMNTFTGGVTFYPEGVSSFSEYQD